MALAPGPSSSSERGVAASFLRILGWFELYVAAAAFLVVCGVVSINALLRFGFNSSIVWSEEIALLATNVFVFLGAAVILKANADVAVTFVVDKLAPRARTLAILAIYAASAAFFAALFWQSLALWPLQRTTSTFILDISRYWFTVPLVWAAASMLLSSLTFALDTAADLLRSRQQSGPRRYLILPVEPE
jgi:TRAP-type C4-dicarboxylate transport system permease small subunit